MSDLELVQGSDAWKAARIGSLGASSIADVVARTKSGWSASRQNRLAALVLERITGQAQDTFTNAAMQHGIDTEPEARAAYSFMTDADVREVGLIRHPRIKGTHASPDGLIGEKGLVEIKCPMPAAHLALLMGQPIPDKYVLQMLWQMACTQRAYCDFASFQPAFPAHLRLWVRRIPFDAKRVEELEADVAVFLEEVDAAVLKLGGMKAAA